MIQTRRMYSQDIGMEFEFGKWYLGPFFKKPRGKLKGTKRKKIEDYLQVLKAEIRQTIYVKKRRTKRTSRHWRLSMGELEDYNKKCKERQIPATSNRSDNINTDWKTTKTRKHKYEKKTKKTTVWIFHATNWRDCIQEDVKMVTKETPQERNWISSKSCRKQCYKDQLYKIAYHSKGIIKLVNTKHQEK